MARQQTDPRARRHPEIEQNGFGRGGGTQPPAEMFGDEDETIPLRGGDLGVEHPASLGAAWQGAPERRDRDREYSTGRTQRVGSAGGEATRYSEGRCGGDRQEGYSRVSDENDHRRYGAAGRGGRYTRQGPKGYSRPDDRIHEDVCERLYYADVDVANVTVHVHDRIVTLEGTVPERWMKFRIEDLCDAAAGVGDVDNRIRVNRTGGGAPA